MPPRVIVAIWGLESNFGRFSGVRPTIQALATLAWEGRRGAFFRGELMDALEIVDRGYIGLEALRGSWAGAMGQPQFMPSSYLKWAQDFDDDGDRDIWRSKQDIFASIANYLNEHGWTRDTTWGREVRLPPASASPRCARKRACATEGCRAEREMTERLPLAKWQALGVRTISGHARCRRAAIEASLIHTGKRAFLVYGNYESLLEYNCAHSYALAVALLSERSVRFSRLSVDGADSAEYNWIAMPSKRLGCARARCAILAAASMAAAVYFGGTGRTFRSRWIGADAVLVVLGG